jgi:hypothetical protein
MQPMVILELPVPVVHVVTKAVRLASFIGFPQITLIRRTP